MLLWSILRGLTVADIEQLFEHDIIEMEGVVPMCILADHIILSPDGLVTSIDLDLLRAFPALAEEIPEEVIRKAQSTRLRIAQRRSTVIDDDSASSHSGSPTQALLARGSGH